MEHSSTTNKRSARDLFHSLKSRASSRSLLHSQTSSSSLSGFFNDDSQNNEPSLPLPEITHPFPVIEQPQRVVLTCLDPFLTPMNSAKVEQYRLSSTKAGEVKATTSCGDKEQFLLIPADPSLVMKSQNMDEDKENGSIQLTRCTKSKDVFYLRSYKFNRYLSSDVSGSINTVDLTKKGEGGKPLRQLGESEKWILMRSPHGGHFIISSQNELNIACYRDDDEALRIGLKGENDKPGTWGIEFVSGELCFVSSCTDRHIRCDLIGGLTLTDDKRGWEVWRFVEVGGGKVRIVSWMHPFCIVCNHEGEVSTAGLGKADEGCDEWTVEKAPEGFCGVVIKAVACARRILSHGEVGLSTSQTVDGESEVWRLDAAHSQTYTLASVHHGRSIGPCPLVTDNIKHSDQIVLQQVNEDGTVRIYHKALGQYLRSCADDAVECSPSNLETDTSVLWKMQQCPEGGYFFTSTMNNRMLSFTDDEENPRLCTVSEATNDRREVWAVNPLLPRAVSSSKIKTFALGTSIAVGTTVAMPFLMAGMIAALPAEATLAASILSVGLTSAEAIASVGAIGATAVIVFREESDTLGIESESGEEDDSKEYTKRPLCSWRSW